MDAHLRTAAEALDQARLDIDEARAAALPPQDRRWLDAFLSAHARPPARGRDGHHDGIAR